MTSENKNMELIPHLLAGAAGAIAGLFDRWLKKRPKSLMEAVIIGAMEAFVGMFSAWVLASLATSMGKPDWSLMAAGLGGWGGGKTIELSRKAMRRALGIPEDKDEEK